MSRKKKQAKLQREAKEEFEILVEDATSAEAVQAQVEAADESRKVDLETEAAAVEAEDNADDEVEVLREGVEEPQIALSDYNALEAKFADLQDQLLRVTAEYENFRRRTRKEKQALYDDATCNVVRTFLPVLDNLERALSASSKYEHEESKQVLAGVELIYKQAQNSLSQLQVTETAGKGEVFDPEQHVAIMHVEDAELDSNTIKEVIEKGYKLKDKVIRHCTVIVAN